MESQFIGARISLISKSDIRYVGTLHSISQVDSTIALENVRSYGTENRRVGPEKMGPSPSVFEYILFRASDVKDLHVEDPKNRASDVPNDPAIISSSKASALPAGQHSGLLAGSLPYADPQQTAGLHMAFESEPASTRAYAPVYARPRGVTNGDVRNGSDVQDDSRVVVDAYDERHGYLLGSYLEMMSTPVCLPSEALLMVVCVWAFEGCSHSYALNIISNTGNLPGTGTHLLHNRRGRGGRRFDNQARDGAQLPLPTQDFDFESSNAKFDKGQLVKEVGNTAEDAIFDAERADDGEGSSPAPQPVVYYDKSSFFDNISCETKERQQMGQEGRTRVPGERRAWQLEERRLNVETFGQTSIDGGRHRRNFRGRGGYRGGFRGAPGGAHPGGAGGRDGGGGFRGGGRGRGGRS
ncbi:MAG: Scd6-like Sm domain-containing protein [Olpidium bornovanus]|uniref:Scd6-like Sm domain-containing protein n=1 Tax=Olpidium bornovanus TaxID=278681 RepID=A0A8H8DES2_9FUNG|nr:MAG: Scd6-like Sm domain-containing protein [Olpidium bornovanus]